jgi:hypothetical protein
LLSVPFALHSNTVEIDKVDDADNDPFNEIQQLNLSGTTLSLSKGGGSVTLPTSGGGSNDNWGTQSVVSDATLDGAGTTVSPLKLADNAVNSAKIADGAVTGSKIEAGAISSDKIETGAVTGTKIAQSGASSGQVLKWDGAQWSPDNDEIGESDLILPYFRWVDINGTAFSILNSDESGYGISISASNVGIRGQAAGTTGHTIGVHGFADSDEGTGVSGQATSPKGLTAGVNGISRSNEGTGVRGVNTSETGASYGVRGISYSDNGRGIYGRATSTNGFTRGVYGHVDSPDGFSGYFTGGKFYVQGKTGIGTNSPATTLHVYHGTLAQNANPTEGLRLHNSGANNNSWTLYTVNSNGNLQFYANNTLRGTFSATSGTYTSSSNRRLKTDITALNEDILKRTLQLEPVSYRFISNPQSEPTIGFIAEDVQPLFPELVEVTGENGENLGVNYAAFSVVAIKAIQQQQKQLEALQTENEQLKKRLERLESLVASTAQKRND